MKKTPIHAQVYVHDARPTENHATIAIRFSREREGMTYWYVRSQRNNLSTIGRTAWDVLERKTLLRWEAERIERDPYRDQWDTVPGFGIPYAATLEADARAVACEAFLAFVRVVSGQYIETPSQLLALLASDRRIALTVEWEWCAAGSVYTSIHDLPTGRRYGCARFLNSPEVLESKAEELMERAEWERKRAARRAGEEAEAAE